MCQMVPASPSRTLDTGPSEAPDEVFSESAVAVVEAGASTGSSVTAARAPVETVLVAPSCA